MMISTQTVISFHIPDEYNLACAFKAQHTDWIEAISTNYIGYIKRDTYAVDAKEEGGE